jgi:hypothetical protein
MAMQSTSTLTIKWAFRGKPKNPFFTTIGGDVIVRVDSRFVMNQISGQVLEQIDSWDLSSSSLLAQAYFWLSRRVYSTVESGKDTIEAAKSTASGLSSKKDQDIEAYPPLGDPTKVHDFFPECVVLLIHEESPTYLAAIWSCLLGNISSVKVFAVVTIIRDHRIYHQRP